jgi:hypothetical protein
VAQLARVLDPEALDRAEGPWGRVVVEVPDAWSAAGDAVEMVVPLRVACARCEGGGCDDCGRSGALRLPAEEAARTLVFSLPEAPEAPGVARLLRLVRPLGPDAGLAQLWIEVRSAPEASPFVRRLPRDRSGARGYATLAGGATVLAILLALALLVAVLSGRR